MKVIMVVGRYSEVFFKPRNSYSGWYRTGFIDGGTPRSRPYSQARTDSVYLSPDRILKRRLSGSFKTDYPYEKLPDNRCTVEHSGLKNFPE